MSNNKPKKGKLVYSTRPDADVSKSGKNKQKAKGRSESLPPKQQTIYLSLDRKGRRGKSVTVATGFKLTQRDLKKLHKALKQLCGAGGTTIDNGLEIQGDQRDTVEQALQNLGYQVKRSGG